MTRTLFAVVLLVSCDHVEPLSYTSDDLPTSTGINDTAPVPAPLEESWPTPLGTPVVLPGQDVVVDIVWRKTWGVTDVAPPVVNWILGDALNCGTGDVKWGWWNGVECSTGRCCVGDSVLVPWPADATVFIQTYLVHEMCHYLSWKRGWPDPPDHSNACFVPGGLVDLGNWAIWYLEPVSK